MYSLATASLARCITASCAHVIELGVKSTTREAWGLQYDRQAAGVFLNTAAQPTLGFEAADGKGHVPAAPAEKASNGSAGGLSGQAIYV